MADTSSQAQQPPSPALERDQLTVSRRRPEFQVLAAVIGLGFVAGLVLLIYLVHPPTTRLSYAALAARSWQVLAFSAAIGLASAAILQVGKQVFGLRSIWQRRWVKTWVQSRCNVTKLWESWLRDHRENFGSADRAGGIAKEQAAAAWQQLQTALLGAYAYRDLRLVFDLPAEQLCALLAAAADSALTSPQENAELLLAFSGPVGLADIDLVAPPQGIKPVKGSEGEVTYRIDRVRAAPGTAENVPRVVVVEPGVAEGPEVLEVSAAEAGQSPPADDAALGRLAQSVRSGLDVLQASISQGWSKSVRTWAVVLSGGLGTAIVLFIRVSAPDRLLFATAALLLGGFFAWVFRDLTAVVERIRR
jgi:hypothetical protein